MDPAGAEAHDNAIGEQIKLRASLKKKPLSSGWFSSVYDVLVRLGGANETMRDSFVHNHTDKKSPCTEWRFCGHLGYGGKYRSERNRVDCYREDETPARAKIIREVNAALSALENNEGQRTARTDVRTNP